MKTIALEIIPKPDPRSATVLQMTKSGPVIQGEGDITYICGSCSAVLGENVARGSVQHLVIRCFDCKNYNAIRGT